LVKFKYDKIDSWLKPLFVEHQGDFEVQEVIDDGAVKVNVIGECQACIYKGKIDQIVSSNIY